MYPLDRTTFKAYTVTDADASHAVYYKKLTGLQRLKIALYLNSIAYNFPMNHPPRLDKTKFSVRGHCNEQHFQSGF